jgi:hypothetical protein
MSGAMRARHLYLSALKDGRTGTGTNPISTVIVTCTSEKSILECHGPEIKEGSWEWSHKKACADMPGNMGGGWVQGVCFFVTDPALVNPTKLAVYFGHFQDFEEILSQIRPWILLSAL